MLGVQYLQKILSPTYFILRNLKIWDAAGEGKCLPNRWGYQGHFNDSRYQMQYQGVSGESADGNGICTSGCIEGTDFDCGTFSTYCLLAGKKTPGWGWYNNVDCDGTCFNNLAGGDIWPLAHNSNAAALGGEDNIISHKRYDDIEIEAAPNYIQHCDWVGCLEGGNMVRDPLIPIPVSYTHLTLPTTPYV